MLVTNPYTSWVSSAHSSFTYGHLLLYDKEEMAVIDKKEHIWVVYSTLVTPNGSKNPERSLSQEASFLA
jgi:hypothetical protein